MSDLILLLPMLAAASITSDDAYTAIGSALSVIIAVKHADKNDKSVLSILCIVTATFFMGITLPGAMVWWFKPVKFTDVPWTVWALLGFFAGLSGWGLVSAATKFFGTVKFITLVKSFLARLFGLEDKSK